MSQNQFARYGLRPAGAALLIAVLPFASASSAAQDTKRSGKGKQPDFIPADYDDYQNMRVADGMLDEDGAFLHVVAVLDGVGLGFA